MSSLESLRKFVNERLTAAAEEIVQVFQQTIVEYEKEIDRQRKFLDVLGPQVVLHKIEIPQQPGCKEEVVTDQQPCNQERNSSLDHEDPEPPQIKEEQEEYDHSEDRTLVSMSVITSDDDLQLLSNSSYVTEIKDEEGDKHEDLESTRDEQTTMAGSKPTRLKVILGNSNTGKLTLPNGVPEKLDDLLSKIKTSFGLEGNIRLQYMDQDFGNDFLNLNSTTELQDLGTVKVIHQQTNPCLISATDNISSHCLSLDSDGSGSFGSSNAIILSSPEFVSSRKHQWPKVFQIPRFSYDTELQLEKGNSEYQMSHKMLTLNTRVKSDILSRLAEQIYQYKAYPEDAHFSIVAEALIKKHPCLREPGSFNGCYGWKQRLKYKMGNYRTLLKQQGCPEVSVNSLKSKVTADAFSAKNVKRPKRAEANFYPSFPIGDTVESLEKERLELLREIMIRNNERIIADKMDRTFAYRRQEVVSQEPSIKDFKDRWPALFHRREINAEFQRLTTVPLEEKFMAQLDMYSSQLIRIICAKGGTTRQKTADIIDSLAQTEDIHLRRECVLKAVIMLLGENAGDLIKEYLDSSADEAQRDLEELTMAVFVIRKEGVGQQEPPADIGIVIDGVEVLHELKSVASACALLLGLVYVLNLAYPKPLRFTFEMLQKIIMQLEPHRMSPKVQNLYGRLQSLQ